MLDPATMPDLTLVSYMLLFGAAVLGGFVDSVAGGGGIITVPALMAVGGPPHFALGTNKLQASFGSFTATLNYRRGKLLKIRELKLGIAMTAIGAVLGTIVIQSISAGILEYLIPVMLLAVFIYMLCNPKLGDEHKDHRIRPGAFYLMAGLALGFYDGFFGPGTGSFWTITLVIWLGFDLKKATAHTKAFNFTSNIVALLTFIIGGKVLFLAGVIMGSGQILGAFVGSHMVLNHGTRLVRIFFLTVVAITILKTIWSAFVPS